MNTPNGENTTTNEPQQPTEAQAAEAASAEEAGFGAGFAEARGSEPPAQETTRTEELAPAADATTTTEASDADAKAKADAEAKAAADGKAAEEAKAAADAKAAAEREWEGVPPVVRKQLEELSSKVGTVQEIGQRVRTLEGRTGAALNGVDALKKAMDAAKTASSTGAEAPTSEQIAAATASTERWKALKDDYPDWADAMEERFAAERAELHKLAKGAGAGVDVEALRRDIAQESVTTARQLARVDNKHPGWEQTINTPAFVDWLKGQPKETQGLAESSAADDAIKLLDTFQSHVDTTKAARDAEAARTAAAAEAEAAKQRRTRNLESAAATPRGAGAPVRAVETEEDAFAAGFKTVRPG